MSIDLKLRKYWKIWAKCFRRAWHEVENMLILLDLYSRNAMKRTYVFQLRLRACEIGRRRGNRDRVTEVEKYGEPVTRRTG